MSEIVQPLDLKTQASLKVKGFIDAGYNERTHLEEIIARGITEELEPIVAMRREEAEILSDNGYLVTIREAFTERQVVSCPSCDFHSTAIKFDISHYRVDPGSTVTYEQLTGFVSSSGKIDIKRIKGMGIEDLHKIRELHSPSDKIVQEINGLFD